MQLVKVYRSKKHTDMYLYVDAVEQFERVPQALRERFGQAVEAMELELTSDRVLARTTAADVLAAIAGQGFYLQLPPEVDPVTGAGRKP